MILCLALDGMNRCGKGTQLGLLSGYLKEENIPHVIVRGDGSREGGGETRGDPPSEWWRSFRQRERVCPNEQARFACWNEAADRLAAEFLTWRHELLPAEAQDQKAPYGVLLVDRSLLSRLLLARDADPHCTLDSLYRGDWQGGPLSWRQLLPDALIVLAADRTSLLRRLDPQDPKFAFRYRLITEKLPLFERILRELPTEIAAVTTVLDGTAPPAEIQQRCRALLRGLVER